MRAFLDTQIGLSPGALGTAILVDGDRIVATGRDDEILSLLPQGGESIRLGGGVVLPGFQDAHAHLCDAGQGLTRPSLASAKSLSEALELLARFSRESSGDRIFVEGFEEIHWPEKRPPTLEELDAIEPARPLIVRRVCTHVAVANSKALERIGRNRQGVDYDSGLMEEGVVFALDEEIFPPTREENRRSILQGQERAFSLGITTVHEFEGLPLVEAYRSLDREGKLRLRVFCFLSGSLEEVEALWRNNDTKQFRVAGMKVFLDGSIGGKTAAVQEPYVGGGNGRLLWERPMIARLFREAEAARLPVAFHAIGDRAIDALLAAREEANDVITASIPYRIEHAEMLSEEAASRVLRCGLLLSMQPNFAGLWGGAGGLYEERLGPERARQMNRYGSWIRRGIPLAFGSDAMPLDPFYGLSSAMHHPAPEERISWERAIHHYTATAEQFVADGGDAGVLGPGKRGDFLWFDRLPVPDSPLAQSDLRLTVAGGETVYER